MTNALEALKSAQFVVDTNGQRVAVQLSVAAWETLLDWVEDQEDAAIVKAALPQLQQLQDNPNATNWVEWDAVKDQWDED